METNNKKLSGLKLNNAAKFMCGLIIFILAVDYAIISVSAIECDTGSVIVVSVLDNDGVTVSGAFVSASFNGSVIDAGTTNNNGEIAFTIPMGNFPDDITPIDVNITASVNGYCGSAIKTIACGTPPDVTETTINLNHPCVSNSTENEKCVVPEDNFYVNEDTLLCGGVYNISDYNAQEVIIINASDVVLDCNGATLKGTGSGSGIDVSSKNNVTIKNCNIEGYEYSIYEYMSQNSIINNNNLSGNSYGIGIFYSNNTNISGNLIKWNFPNGGIYMSNSNLGAINENIIYGNDNGIYLTNSQNTELNGNIVCGNYNIDFSLTNSSGTGNNNTCDTGNWNDTLKDGCSYSCLEGLAITINETTDTPVIAGDGIIKYNMTIKNTGNKTAYNLITRDTLPYGTYIFDLNYSAACGTVMPGAKIGAIIGPKSCGRPITCPAYDYYCPFIFSVYESTISTHGFSLSSLTSGSECTITYKVNVTKCPQTAPLIRNTVTARVYGFDLPALYNDTVDVIINCTPMPDLIVANSTVTKFVETPDELCGLVKTTEAMVYDGITYYKYIYNRSGWVGTTWVNNRGLVKTTEAVVGDEIAIYADIKNLDNLFDSNLDRINISLYVDNKYYSSKIQNLIGIYESSYGLNFTWIAKPGVHNLTIIIDPNNAINESDESNNNLTTTITVHCRSDYDNDGFCNEQDNCPYTPNNQSDLDNDGLGDACDYCTDANNNGLCDYGTAQINSSCNFGYLINNLWTAEIDGDINGMKLSDIDGDGRDEIILVTYKYNYNYQYSGYYNGNYTISIIRNDNNNFTKIWNTTVKSYPYLTFADIDNDNKKEIIVQSDDYSNYDNSKYLLSVFKNNETGSLNFIKIREIDIKIYAPDMVFTGINFSSETPSNGEPVNIKFRILNNGSTDAVNVPVEIRIWNNLHIFWAANYVNVPAYNEVTVQFNWTAVFGNNNVYGYIDRWNQLIEKNESNNIISTNINVVDLNPPQINLLSPANNSIINGNLIEFSIQDDVFVDMVLYSINGGEYTQLYSPFYVFTNNWTSGQYIINVYANDTSGNSANKTYVFTVDATPPEVHFSMPGHVYINETNDTVEISVDIFDETGVKEGYSGIYFNNRFTQIPLAYGFDDGKWKTSFTVNPGYYSVKITATDLLGNVNDSEYAEFDVSKIVNSTIDGSLIIASIVTDSKINNSEIKETVLENSIINSSFVLASAIKDSGVRNGEIRESIIEKSVLEDTKLNISGLINSYAIDSEVIDSYLTNCEIINSTIIRTVFGNATFVNATVVDYLLTKGIVVIGNETYYAPYDLYTLLPPAQMLEHPAPRMGTAPCPPNIGAKIGASIGVKISAKHGARIGAKLSQEPVISDLDGDGRKEIITVMNQIYVFENNGGNNFIKVWNSNTISGYVNNILINDTDNDGKLELIVSAQNKLYIFENTGDNSYTEIWNYSTDNVVNNLFIEDLNNDGKKEIVAFSYYGKIHIFENTGGNSYTEVWNYGINSYRVWLNDLDNDGKKEVIFYTDQYDYKNYNHPHVAQIHILENDGSNHYAETVNISLDDWVNNILFEDLNHDDVREMIVAGSKIYIYESTGDNFYVKTYDSGSEINSIGNVIFGDLNGDGKKELFVQSYGNPPKISVFEIKLCEGVFISKSTKRDTYYRNEEFNYTIILKPNFADAADINVTDTLPDGLDFVSCGAGCETHNKTVTWNLNNESCKTFCKLSLNVKVGGNVSGNLINTAAAKVGDAYGHIYNASADSNIYVSPPRIEVNKYPASQWHRPTDNNARSSFTITVTAKGILSNVTLIDVLPESARFISSEPTPNQTGDNLTWNLGDMENEVKNINLTIDFPGVSLSWKANTVRAKGEYANGISEDTSSAYIRISDYADPVWVFINPENITKIPGSSIKFTITTIVEANTSTQYVETYDTPPDGFKLITASGNPVVQKTNGKTILKWTQNGPFPSGVNTTFNYEVIVKINENISFGSVLLQKLDAYSNVTTYSEEDHTESAVYVCREECNKQQSCNQDGYCWEIDTAGINGKNDWGETGGHGSGSSTVPMSLKKCLDDSGCSENESCVNFLCTGRKIENNITGTNLNKTIEEIKNENEFETNKSNIEAGNNTQKENPETTEGINEKSGASNRAGVPEKYIKEREPESIPTQYIITGVIVLAVLAVLIRMLRR